MTSSAGYGPPRWFTIGDINAFFGLMLDNVVNLAVLSGILIGGSAIRPTSCSRGCSRARR